MNTALTRSQRLSVELAKFSQEQLEQLEQPMYDLPTDGLYGIPAIDSLVQECGSPSSRGYINDGNAWNHSLRQVVTALVDSLYTLDGKTAETTEELEALSACS